MGAKEARKANQSYLTPGGLALTWITRVHVALYQRSRGTLGWVVVQRAEQGTGLLGLRPMTVLLLTTRGRKSGEERTVALPYFRYDGRVIVVGSNAAQRKHPAWYHNIKADPDVSVQLGWHRRSAQAIPLEGDDYERGWAQLAADWPRYGVYQASTERQIPVVELRFE